MRPRKLLLSLMIAAAAALPGGFASAAPTPVATLATPAPTVDPVDEATARLAAKEVDELAKAIIVRGVPGLAVAVVRGDTTLLARGYGQTGGPRGERIDERTVFAR